jgi:hypothetical protein
MGWLLVLATALTLAAAGFAGITAYLVMCDRRRRRAAHQRLLAHQRGHSTAPASPVEVEQLADRAQRWLDDLWEQKFGRGLRDSTGSADG